MQSVIIVIHLMVVLAMVGLILLQKSEGGGLGMGGGGGGGGFMSARGSANLLTRTTAILGTLFMATAIGLSIISQVDRGSSGILDRAVQGDGTPATVLDALDAMGGNDDLAPSAPAAPAPAAPAESDLAVPPAATEGQGDIVAPEVAPVEPAPPAPASEAAPADTTAPADEQPAGN